MAAEAICVVDIAIASVDIDGWSEIHEGRP
jgi:hypothetical protein